MPTVLKPFIPSISTYIIKSNNSTLLLFTDKNIIALNPWDGDDTYDFSNAIWYRQASENPGKVIFTDTYMDAIYKKPVITIAKKCASGAVLAFDIFPEKQRRRQRESRR